MKLFRAMLICAMLLCAQLLLGSDKPVLNRVEISISMDDSSLQDRVESAISRHLRDLSDTLIVEGNGTYTLAVSGFPSANKAGQKTGFVLTATFLAPLDTGYLISFLDTHFPEVSDPNDQRSAILKMLELARVPDASRVLLYSNIYTGALNEDLESTCRDVVAAFDTHVLRKERELRQQINAAVEEGGADRKPATPSLRRHPVSKL